MWIDIVSSVPKYVFKVFRYLKNLLHFLYWRIFHAYSSKNFFLHVPKTGGSWVKKVIAASNIECRNYSISDNAHIGLKDCPCLEKFKFAFVRHPVDLYRSYWQFKMTYGWDRNNPLDMECRSDSFHKFVRDVLDKFTGVYSKSLIDFVGETNDEIEFIGKYENLVDDLVFALKAAGEICDETFIRTFPVQNVSDKIAFPAVYTDQLENDVRSAESMVIKRFNYE